MVASKQKKKGGGLVALVIILILLALPFVAVYVYTKNCAFDVAAIRAAQTESLQAAGDAIDFGSVSVFYSPARVYELVDNDTLNEKLNETLHGTVALNSFAIEPGDGRCTVYADVSVLGILPLTLRAEADVTAQNSDIGVWFETLELGTKISVPLEESGINRTVTLTPSAPVINVQTSADGFTVSYRFLQEHFLSGLKQDTALTEAYSLFCPAEADGDWAYALWASGSTLSRDKLCSNITTRAELTDVLALANDATADNFLRNLSAFESDTLFPGAAEAVSARKAQYRDAAAQAYRDLTDTATAVASYSPGQTYYVTNESVMLRAKRVADNTTVTADIVTPGCSLIDTEQSRFVLLYFEKAPVPPASDDAQQLKNIEAKEFLTKGILLIKRTVHFAPALITRFAGEIPCILYRDTDGNTVFSHISEEAYAAFTENGAGLVLLDDYQTGTGIVFSAPAGAEDLPGYRFIDIDLP